MWRALRPVLQAQPPRGAGIAAAALIMLASVAYGVVRGDHVATIVEALKDLRDSAANAAGFRIVALALTGARHMSREEVLATAGVTGRTSLLFLDVDAARERLKANPWVADATVLKLYPGELQIGITERATRRILVDLQDSGYIAREKIGRRNRYSVNAHRPLVRIGDGALTAGQLLEFTLAPVRSPRAV